MLRVEGLRVAHGPTEVLHGIDLEVGAGESVALIGSNGAGKSTLLRTVCGLMAPHGGTIEFASRSVAGTPAHALARLGIAYVPAERRLFPTLSVMENLAMGGYPHRAHRRRYDHVFALFPRLAERRSQAAGTMSGGEQQMLALARALMSAPDLLLLDEPSTGLAPRLAEEAYRALAALRAEDGLSVLVAEQQVALVLASTDRGYVIEAGEVRLAAPSPVLRDHPEVRRAYLGLA